MGGAEEIGSGPGGGAPGSGGSGGDDPTPPAVVHTYVFLVSGTGEEFAGVLTTNVDDPDEIETVIHQHVIAAGPEDTTVYGRNVMGDFAKRGGVGTLTVELWRDGVLFDTQSTAVNGTSLAFSADF